MKLTPEERHDILKEMVLAESFSTEAWSRRYRISPRQVKRLRAEVRAQLARRPQEAPVYCKVMLFNSAVLTRLKNTWRSLGLKTS